MGLIFESRKDDAISNLQRRFPYDKSFIRRVFDIDPTYAGKYASYIENTLPELIISIAGEEGGLSVGQQTRIENIYQNVRWFELNHKYFTPKIIEKFLEDTNMVDNPEEIMRSPKDISSYKNPYVLYALKEVVEKNRGDREQIEIAKSQTVKLFEDENYLVVEPLSHASCCYYGKNTKWCKSSSIEEYQNFNSFLRKGKVVFFIDKNNPNGKSSMFIPKNLSKNRDNLQIWDDKDSGVEIDFLYTNFPELSDFIDELTGYYGGLYKLLVGYVKGKVTSGDLLNGDELVYNMRGLKSKNKENSIIIFKFDDDENYFKACGLDEEDVSFANRIFNPYYGMELHDSYSSWENWYDGVIRDYYFDDENKNKFDDIVILVEPTAERENDRYWDTTIYKKIDKLFEKQIRNIIYEYNEKYNDALISANKDSITADLENIFSAVDIHKMSTFSKYFTTVENLILLYEKFDNTRRRNLTDLLVLISGELDVPKNFWDYMYEVNTDKYFEKDSFNYAVGTELDDILEKIEEDESLKDQFTFIREVNDKILRKYKIGSIYTLPADQYTTFKITDINKEDSKIKLSVSRKGKGEQKIELTIPEFFQFLNTYPMF